MRLLVCWISISVAWSTVGTIALISLSAIAQPVISCDDMQAELISEQSLFEDAQDELAELTAELQTLQSDLNEETNPTIRLEFDEQISAKEMELENQEILTELFKDAFKSKQADYNDSCTEQE